jgi:hypothetical protein
LVGIPIIDPDVSWLSQVKSCLSITILGGDLTILAGEIQIARVVFFRRPKRVIPGESIFILQFPI